jgi:mannose-6-phosphate isomerase-like protein (cupin superfamily)
MIDLQKTSYSERSTTVDKSAVKSAEIIVSAQGDNFSAIDLGPFEKLNDYRFAHPRAGRVTGKVFTRQALKLTGMEVSMNKLPPGVSLPFYHQHKQNEELYIFVKGQGQMQIDGQVVDVREGTMVRIATGGTRTWRNNSDEPLYYVVVQARENSLEQATVEDGIASEQPVTWE